MGKPYFKPWGFESVYIKFDTGGHRCPRKQKHQSESPRPIPVPGGQKWSTLKVSGGLKKFGWAVFEKNNFFHFWRAKFGEKSIFSSI